MKALVAAQHHAHRLASHLADRLREGRHDDRGEAIQTVIITAGLALLALLVIAAIKGAGGKFIDVVNGLTPNG
ncbi:hypothetical protein GCM10010124_25360 [Pilimelia terevasa]|uniref:Uncharacterized protein n=1 Tax=Pilimelia terevasa TaxID=53372 RepID=A0A8J3BLR5_9ACTN|nr:hypothetical protein [Pilimelia terevasa]GGK31492.1 hypothetical protein GCM10010124_25360 [Pilimelia terevasa]